MSSSLGSFTFFSKLKNRLHILLLHSSVDVIQLRDAFKKDSLHSQKGEYIADCSIYEFVFQFSILLQCLNF